MKKSFIVLSACLLLCLAGCASGAKDKTPASGNTLTDRITVKAEDHSPDFDTEAGETLSFRFYPREESFDLERNTVYPVVLKWEGEGLPTEASSGTF